MNTEAQCPECKSTPRTFHNLIQLGNGRTRRDGWNAYCPAVTRCKVARSGITGHADKRPEAIADFITKANSQNG